jgi:glycosyltransferase involved in cell wall biosynthesis/GT2 family glycosyltransferase
MPSPSRFNESVKVLFASCGPALLEPAVAKAMSIRPDLPLVVVSEFEPSQGRWIRYEAGSKFRESVRSCRGRLKDKQVEVAIVVSQPRGPHRMLRFVGLLTGPRCVVVLNENLDYFDLHPHSARAIARHLYRRAADWLRPLRRSSTAPSDTSVKALFASCAPALLDAAVAKASSIRPDLPLVVVSQDQPPAGRWIRYRSGSTVLESLRCCRERLEGRQVEVSIVVLQPRTTDHRRLRILGFLNGLRCLVVMNENLDFFDVHPLSAPAIARYFLRRAANWIRPATFRRSHASLSGRSVKALFTSCTPALLEDAVAQAASIRPDLPLVVVSEFAPPAGHWIRYRVGWQFLENLRYCRDRLKDKQVEVAIVVSQPRVPYRKLRLIGFLTVPQSLVIMTENFDHFDVHPFFLHAIARHFLWRAGNWIRFSIRAGRPHLAPRHALAVLSRRIQRLRALRAYAAGFALQFFCSRSECLTAPAPVAPSQRPRGISVVIASRDGRDRLESMLPALRSQLETGEIIVVDDGSADGTMDFLRRCFPAVTALRNQRSPGWAGAVNTAIRAARFSHICLLDSGMAVAPGFFHHLQKAFAETPGLFCASPHAFSKPGVESTPATSDFSLRCDSPVEGENLTYVLYGSRGCSLFEAERLLLLNGLDESYHPASVEDLDLGVRAWQHGWPTVSVAGAHLVHQPQAGISRLDPQNDLAVLMARNWLLFLARTVRDREVFVRYWRQAVARLSRSAADGNVHACRGLGEVAITGKWRVRRQTAEIPDSEIFALCNGSVAVFPGAGAKSLQPVVLIATPYLPFPLAHGGAVRMYNLMRRAAARWKLVLVSFVETPAPVPAELRAICAEVVTVHRTEGRHRQSTRRPDVVEEFDSPSFRSALRQTIRKWQPQIVQLEFTQLAQYGPDCAGARTILAEHDITFDLYQQLLDGFDDEYLRRQLDRWTRFERNAWNTMDRVVTMSGKDQRMVGTGNAVVIPNGVDLEHFRPCPDPPEPGRLLFLGSFRHFPNLAGLDLFLNQVWPKVQPLGVRLHVVAGPDYRMWLDHYRERVVLDLAQPGIEVEEFVPDVRPAYARAEIVVVPLVSSAGTNIKVLEALSMGKAIVTTAKGINGLELTSGDAVLVADTPDEFAGAIAGLIQEQDRRKQLELRARRVAEERFGWESSAAAQNLLYEALLGAPRRSARERLEISEVVENVMLHSNRDLPPIQ